MAKANYAKKRGNDETNTHMQYTIDALYINNGALRLPAPF